MHLYEYKKFPDSYVLGTMQLTCKFLSTISKVSLSIQKGLLKYICITYIETYPAIKYTLDFDFLNMEKYQLMVHYCL